jgi:hypothetical protein
LLVSMASCGLLQVRPLSSCLEHNTVTDHTGHLSL